MSASPEIDEEIPTPLRKEVGPFIAVGVFAVAVDFLLFNVFLLLGWPVWLANGVALLVSMSVSFVGNYKWTFAHREIKSLWHAYGTFTSINVLTVVFIELAVVAAEQYDDSGLFLNLVKAVATAVATVARFFAYKRWVFF
jgi:putative flippase GtrA